MAFGVNNGLGLVNKTDAHFSRALGADKRICFVHLSDEVRPALFYLHRDEWRGDLDELRFPNDVFLVLLFPIIFRISFAQSAICSLGCLVVDIWLKIGFQGQGSPELAAVIRRSFR